MRGLLRPKRRAKQARARALQTSEQARLPGFLVTATNCCISFRLMQSACSGIVIQKLMHSFACLEMNTYLGLSEDRFPGAWVACLARRMLLGLKNTKAAKFDPMPFAQPGTDGIEHCVQDKLGVSDVDRS